MKQVVIAASVVFTLLTSLATVSFAEEREVETHLIQSRILDEERTVYVVLPQDYSADKAYNLLVVLDAMGPEFTDSLLSCDGADLSDVIILGIANTVRVRDMFPANQGPRKPEGGNAEGFMEFLLKEAIPLVEKNWPVAGSRAIMGFSNSGLFALYMLLESPQAFDGCISISPTIGHMPEFMQEKAKRLFEQTDSYPKRIYLDQGSRDYRTVVQYLPEYVNYLEHLAPEDLALKYMNHEGYGHVPDISRCLGLRFVFPKQER